jgi:hypothetical protein
MNEEYVLNKNLVTLECHKHFQEVLFQIDEHREELKKKIDDLSLEMIERTKKYEDLYLKSLNEKFKSIETKSVEQDLEETFRNPNLVFETLNEMLQRHEKTLEDIKLKVNEINQEKINLNASNVFKPNESFVVESFGLLYLNDPFISQILIGQQQPMELIKLCEFSPNDKWSLLYRGSRDGFGAKDFHAKCDCQSNTLTLVKAKATSYIFGGFTIASWDCSNESKWDANAFIFSLTNKDNRPCKMVTTKADNSIKCMAEYGPIFGGSKLSCASVDDIYIGDKGI